MKELNELVELAKEFDASNTVEAAMAINSQFKAAATRETILAIAEAFRELEQRAEAAEAKLAELGNQEPIGRVDRGEANDNNEYPGVRVVCLHEQADWINFQDGTELFLRPSPAVGMEKPEPYAWLVHAPQGDYVERNPEVVAHLEGAGLTKCKPLYLAP